METNERKKPAVRLNYWQPWGVHGDAIESHLVSEVPTNFTLFFCDYRRRPQRELQRYRPLCLQ